MSHKRKLGHGEHTTGPWVWHYSPLPEGALKWGWEPWRLVQDWDTGKASRADQAIQGAMVEQTVQEAMADQEVQGAMVEQTVQEAMADQEVQGAMVKQTV